MDLVTLTRFPLQAGPLARKMGDIGQLFGKFPEGLDITHETCQH